MFLHIQMYTLENYSTVVYDVYGALLVLESLSL